MPERIRLVHEIVGGFHVFTSPDLKGLHVTADTEADAQRAAISVVHAIAREFDVPAPVVEFGTLARAA